MSCSDYFVPPGVKIFMWSYVLKPFTGLVSHSKAMQCNGNVMYFFVICYVNVQVHSTCSRSLQVELVHFADP